MPLSDLISLEGFVTLLSVGAILTVKTLRMTWNVKKDNVSVNGNHNSVTVVRFDRLTFQQGYKRLWTLLTIIVALTYPLAGDFYNSLLKMMAVVCPALSLFALIATLKTEGVSRCWDVFYVIAVLAGGWIIFCAMPYLPIAATNSQSAYPVFTFIVDQNLRLLNSGDSITYVLNIVIKAISGIAGYTLLFLSFGYLFLSFLIGRSFDDALKRASLYTTLLVIGYLLIGGALVNRNGSNPLGLLKNLLVLS